MQCAAQMQGAAQMMGPRAAQMMDAYAAQMRESHESADAFQSHVYDETRPPAHPADFAAASPFSWTCMHPHASRASYPLQHLA